jgi:hypothetical protein
LLVDVPRFGSWLARTREVQEGVFGIDAEALSDDEYAHAWETAAFSVGIEVAEATAHVPWKPWSRKRGRPQGGPGDPGSDRDQAVRELVDAAHFLANLFVLLGVTDEELDRRYAEKTEENIRRQKEGYSG